MAQGEACFGGLLTPQGRLLHDLFIVGREDGAWLDVEAEHRDALLQRLTMYRLGATVELATDDTTIVGIFSAHSNQDRRQDGQLSALESGTISQPSSGRAGELRVGDHVWGRSRKGKPLVKQATAKSRYARALDAVSGWRRKNRHRSIPDQHRRLSSMMRGHFAYYGVGGNMRRLQWFARQVVRIWRKGLSRRDRRSVVLWTRLTEILRQHPLPKAKIFHPYVTAS